MPAISLTVGLVAATILLGSYIFGSSKDDDNRSRPPPPNPSSRYDGTTRSPYRSPPPPPYTPDSYQPPLTHARSQAAAKASVNLNYDRSFNSSNFISPRARESGQTPLTSARSQASYQRFPSLDDTHLFRSSEAIPTHSRAQYSSSNYSRAPTTVDRSQPVRVVPLSPAPAPVVLSDLESDESDDAEDINIARKLREEARSRGDMMSKARTQAKNARQRGDRGAADRHNLEASAHEKAMKNLNERAAKIIFRENNKRCGERMIDLHGLYVHEAVRFAKEQLQVATFRDDEEVRFIVGKGKHSDAGGAKIRPALEELFTEREVTHSLDPKNAGVLIVRLD